MDPYTVILARFVSAIHIPTFSPSILVSGGGDPELKVWDWLSGKLLNDIPVMEVVEPYIKVKPPKSKVGEGDTASGDGSTKPQGRGRRRRRRGKQQEATEDVDVAESGDQESAQNDSADVVMDIQEGGKGGVENEVEGSTPPVEEKQESERPVLVINRIDSVDRGAQGRNIIFSAVGCVLKSRFIATANSEQVHRTVSIRLAF